MVQQLDGSGADAAGAPGGELVFISYCRADKAWRRRFEVMLAPLVRNRGVDVWSDSEIAVGEQWRPALADAIARARLALVLVSGDLLASRFIMDTELPALQQGGARLVCALIPDCMWEQEPTL